LVGQLLVALHFVRAGNLNQDEGWYLYAAGLVYEGLLPYRDFAFFQAPLLPYVYGLPQTLFGPGLEFGRLTSLVLSAVTMALGARLARERGGRLAALVFLGLCILTPQVVWALTTTRTEPLSALLWMLCAFLVLRPSRNALASGGALAAAVLGASTRASALPAAVGVLFFVLLRHRDSPRDLATALIPGLLAALPLAFLLLATPFDSLLFNLVGAQAERHSQLEPAEAWTLLQILAARLRDLHLLHSFYGIVPAISLAAGVAAGFLRWPRREPRDAWSRPTLGVAVLGAAVYLPNLVPRVVFPVYFAAVFPLFALVAAWTLGNASRATSGPARRAVWAVTGVLLLIQLGNFAGRHHAHTSSPPDLAELQETATDLAGMSPDGTLVTLDTYLAVESGLRLAPGFEMGMFAYFPFRSDEEGRRLGVVTPGLLDGSLRSPAVDLVALSDRALGVLVERKHSGYRPFRKLGEEELRFALPGLEGHRLAWVVPEFGQFRDPLYVFVRSGR
jgi:hypothetical protein